MSIHQHPQSTTWSVTFILAALSAIPAAASSEKTLFSFVPWPKTPAEQTGASPNGTLLRDASGALYGATMLSGQYYNGTIFKLTPPPAGQTQWKYTILYTFTGGSDGGMPNSDLVMDKNGAIYGTAGSGGSWLNQGMVFKLTPPAAGQTRWTYSVIHYFYFSYAYGADDGANPRAGLIMDESGALYGTTGQGGDISSVYSGYGIVFKLTPLDAAKTKWQETVLYRFRGGADGANPMFVLTRDTAGSLYGMTLYGGTGHCTDYLSNIIGCGIAFKLTPPAPGHTVWTKTTLHHFTVGVDGTIPEGKLLLDTAGALYGTTFQGGTGKCTNTLGQVIGCGVIFKLTPPRSGQTNWTETILHDFTGPEGANPGGGLIPDGTGALYGTTYGGGPITWGVLGGYGVVYKLTPPAAGSTRWTQKAIYNFDISTSGEQPVGELVRDPHGKLYGVAYSGGSHLGGTVFEITP